MIIIGIDDTDVLDSKGTNQLARAIVQAAADRWRCVRIVRHQLLFDPRVPYTSKNGSASITLESRKPADIAGLIELCRRVMAEWFVHGSDPGLCVTENVPGPVIQFGRLCQSEIVTQSQARTLAAEHGLFLMGLGGTEGGVIGALAAVGLAVTEDDGRIVQLGEWPDDLSGIQSLPVLHARGLDVEDFDRSTAIEVGAVDVGKHLRPNLRGGRAVLFVRRQSSDIESEAYQAIRLP